MAKFGFGQVAFAETEFGDSAGNIRLSRSAALLVTYTILPQGNAALPISYHVQPFGASALPIYYVVLPPIQDISINGVLFPRPTRIDYAMPQQIGVDQSGIPIRQGYSSMIWTYDTLLDDRMSQIMNTYDPNNPEVVITYPNELGVWVQKAAMFQPPNLGTRQTIAHSSVVLTFTHISSD